MNQEADFDEHGARGRYLELLSREFPDRYRALTEIINLKAILNLPKGTEHFISDVHGEFVPFRHLLNNASGVIRDKVADLFATLPRAQRAELCTLIYYPRQYLKRHAPDGQWYRELIAYLTALAVFLSSKYTRSKVRHAIPPQFRFVIDELMHAKADEDNNRVRYHEQILQSLIDTGSAADFIEGMTVLIKRLAVDRLHVLGDLFDRGAHPDLVLDLLEDYHHLDIQWGNHDVLWMGAAFGSQLCAATAVRNNLRYGNLQLLENGYGINLRPLALFAERYYRDEPQASAMYKACSVIMLKLQGEVILRNPDFAMRGRLLLSEIDYARGVMRLPGAE